MGPIFLHMMRQYVAEPQDLPSGCRSCCVIALEINEDLSHAAEKDIDQAGIQRRRPVQIVDLRDYGLERAAPCEDGQKILVVPPGEDCWLTPAY